MEQEDVLFVRVKNPVELRRSILQTTKDVIEALQRHEKFRYVREEKTQRIAELKTDIKEITKLVNKLRSSLPKTNIRLEPMKVAEEPVSKKSPRKIKTAVPVVDEKPKKFSEIDKLEAELREIEDRLEKVK